MSNVDQKNLENTQPFKGPRYCRLEHALNLSLDKIEQTFTWEIFSSCFPKKFVKDQYPKLYNAYHSFVKVFRENTTVFEG